MCVDDSVAGDQAADGVDEGGKRVRVSCRCSAYRLGLSPRGAASVCHVSQAAIAADDTPAIGAVSFGSSAHVANGTQSKPRARSSEIRRGFAAHVPSYANKKGALPAKRLPVAPIAPSTILEGSDHSWHPSWWDDGAGVGLRWWLEPLLELGRLICGYASRAHRTGADHADVGDVGGGWGGYASSNHHADALWRFDDCLDENMDGEADELISQLQRHLLRVHGCHVDAPRPDCWLLIRYSPLLRVRRRVRQPPGGVGRLTNMELREAFASLDTDGSGTVDPDEFDAAMQQLGVQMSNRKRRALLAECSREPPRSLDPPLTHDDVIAMAAPTDAPSERKPQRGKLVPFYEPVNKRESEAYHLNRMADRLAGKIYLPFADAAAAPLGTPVRSATATLTPSSAAPLGKDRVGRMPGLLGAPPATPTRVRRLDPRSYAAADEVAAIYSNMGVTYDPAQPHIYHGASAGVEVHDRNWMRTASNDPRQMRQKAALQIESKLQGFLARRAAKQAAAQTSPVEDACYADALHEASHLAA